MHRLSGFREAAGVLFEGAHGRFVAEGLLGGFLQGEVEFQGEAARPRGGARESSPESCVQDPVDEGFETAQSRSASPAVRRVRGGGRYVGNGL